GGADGGCDDDHHAGSVRRGAPAHIGSTSLDHGRPLPIRTCPRVAVRASGRCPGPSGAAPAPATAACSRAMTGTNERSRVFATGSVSLRCYAPDGDDAEFVVNELCDQARLAVEHGFDGVMTAEHHGGFPGYLPNPVQLAGFLLAAMPVGWAAPCPVLLPLRPTALVAEEVAWLAARYPDRVGVGVAAGCLERDFEVV